MCEVEHVNIKKDADLKEEEILPLVNQSKRRKDKTVEEREERFASYRRK